jgi:hypothetical protein
MADLLNGLGQKLADAASDLGKKTEETIEIQKIRSEVRSLKRENDRDLKDIGRMVYEKYEKGELEGTEYVELCEAIAKREEDIEAQEEQIVRIREA